MALITSAISGNSTVYTITDQAGNVGTVTVSGTTFQSIAYSIGALLYDGVQLLNTLNLMLVTGLRPNVIPNTNASFS